MERGGDERLGNGPHIQSVGFCVRVWTMITRICWCCTYRWAAPRLHVSGSVSADMLVLLVPARQTVHDSIR